MSEVQFTDRTTAGIGHQPNAHKMQEKFFGNNCHKQFKSIDQAAALLMDESGQMHPLEDICRICKEPFTMEQKLALLNAAMEKQKENETGKSGNSKPFVKLPNTQQTQALLQWGQRGQIPLDVNRVRVQGRPYE